MPKDRSSSSVRNLGKDARSLIAAAEVLTDLDMTVIATVTLISSPFIECHRYFFEEVLEKCNPEGWSTGPARPTGFMGQVYRTPDHAVPKLCRFLDSLDPEEHYTEELDTCTGDTVMHMMVRKQWNTEAAWAFANAFLRDWEEFNFGLIANRAGETIFDLLEQLPEDSEFRQKFEAKLAPLQESDDELESESFCSHANCCPCCNQCEIKEIQGMPFLYAHN